MDDGTQALALVLPDSSSWVSTVQKAYKSGQMRIIEYPDRLLGCGLQDVETLKYLDHCQGIGAKREECGLRIFWNLPQYICHCPLYLLPRGPLAGWRHGRGAGVGWQARAVKLAIREARNVVHGRETAWHCGIAYFASKERAQILTGDGLVAKQYVRRNDIKVAVAFDAYGRVHDRRMRSYCGFHSGKVNSLTVDLVFSVEPALNPQASVIVQPVSGVPGRITPALLTVKQAEPEASCCGPWAVDVALGNTRTGDNDLTTATGWQLGAVRAENMHASVRHWVTHGKPVAAALGQVDDKACACHCRLGWPVKIQQPAFRCHSAQVFSISLEQWFTGNTYDLWRVGFEMACR